MASFIVHTLLVTLVVVTSIASSASGSGDYAELDGRTSDCARGVVESGVNGWLTEPTGDASATQSVRYARGNDGLGYGSGYNLLAYLDQIFSGQNSNISFDGFLKFWLAHRFEQPATKALLEQNLEQYSQMNLR